VAGYKVLIDDNYNFMDESERIQHGVFATADEAIAACKLIVDCQKPMLQLGFTVTALYDQYKGFGDDPFCAGRSERRTGGLLSLGICQGTMPSAGGENAARISA
jgi:hypothetical protein